MRFLITVLFISLAEGKDLQNADFVDINVKEAVAKEDNVDMNLLLGKMNGFETLLSAHDERILTMLKTIEAQNLRIVNLEKQVEAMENEKDDQLEHIHILKQRVSALEENCGKSINPEHHNETKPSTNDDRAENTAELSHGTSVEKKRGKRLTLTNQHVAFTAYLDHETSHVGIGQTVVFNQVITNDGNAYNKNNGMFTAPVTGTYFFTFSINVQSTKVNVRLVKDNANLVDVIAHSSAHFTPDPNDYTSAQSTNCVVVQLDAGQAVWAQAYHDADAQIDGYSDYRYVTFSGFLLY